MCRNGKIQNMPTEAAGPLFLGVAELQNETHPIFGNLGMQLITGTCHAYDQGEFMASTSNVSVRVIVEGRHVAAANGIVPGPMQIGTVLSLITQQALNCGNKTSKWVLLPFDAIREVRP